VVRRTTVGCADQKYFIRYIIHGTYVPCLCCCWARGFSLITGTRRLLRPNSRQNSTPRAISLSAVSRPAMIATKRRPDPRYPAEPRSYRLAVEAPGSFHATQRGSCKSARALLESFVRGDLVLRR
jgi:hypothetical protein